MDVFVGTSKSTKRNWPVDEELLELVGEVLRELVDGMRPGRESEVQ